MAWLPQSPDLNLIENLCRLQVTLPQVVRGVVQTRIEEYGSEVLLC
jgi:hypothetical protein